MKKKLLLLIALLIGLFIQAQNQDIINKMAESKSINDIKTVANDIVSKSKNKYNFLKIWKSGRGDEIYDFVVYTPEGMSIAEIKELTAPDFDKCMVVKFKEYYKGENKDLEIKGTLTYYFNKVSEKYLDLVDFWTTTFYPSSTKEQVLGNYKMQEYRVNKDLKYKFQKDYDLWTLVNSY